MDLQISLYRISQLLARFQEHLEILNESGDFSINNYAEDVLIRVLNVIYSCDLENVNLSERKNYPSIDLRDKQKKIAIQVTATNTQAKILDTLRKFEENKLHKTYKHLSIVILKAKKLTYNDEKVEAAAKKARVQIKNVFDLSDILSKIRGIKDENKIVEIEKHLEKQFSDRKEYNKWNSFHKGLIEYDTYITNFFKYIDIRGFSPKIDNTLVKITLENIFIPLRLKDEAIKVEGEPEYHLVDNPLISNNESFFQTQDKILNDNNSYVILGDPGSGKSTLLKFISFDLCAKRLKSDNVEERIPIYIRVSDYANFYQLRQESIGEFIIDHHEKRFEKVFVDALELGNIVLLLDGLDEINSVNLRNDIVTQIISFSSQFTNVKVLVTSRKIGYSQTRLTSNFLHFEVQPFQIIQIDQFIKNWYSAIYASIQVKKDEADERHQNLLNSIRQNQSVLRLARNPLLMTIIALIDYQGTALPEKRVELYEIATSTFLENWVNLRRGIRKLTLDKTDIIEILSPISFQIHNETNDGLIEEKKFKELIISRYLEIYPYESKKDGKKECNELVNFMREDAGFIYEKGKNASNDALFGFVHLTFQEYFASLELVARWKERTLVEFKNYLFDSKWTEVIRLAASQFRVSDKSRLGRKDTSEFVNDIIKIDDDVPELYRPLKIVLNILLDETEVQSDTLEVTSGIVLRLLKTKENKEFRDIHYSTIGYFTFTLSRLLSSKSYGSYILNKLLLWIEKENDTVKHNIIDVLMSASDSLEAKDILKKILKGNDKKLKEYIFNHGVVFPINDIIKSKEFKLAITDYVNKLQSNTSADNRFPLQYYLAYNYLAVESIFNFNPKKSEDVKPAASLFVESIKRIKSKDLQQRYLDEHGSQWIIRNTEEYINNIRTELPKLDFSKFLQEFELRKLAEANNLKYEIVDIDDILLFKKEADKIAIISKKKAEEKKKCLIATMPLSKDNSAIIKSSLKGNKEKKLRLINLLLSITTEREGTYNNISPDDVDILISYRDSFNWYLPKVAKVLNQIILENIVSEKPTLKHHLGFLKRSKLDYEPSKLEEHYYQHEFHKKVYDSKSLQDYEKVYLLSFLKANKNMYKNLLSKVVESYNCSKDQKERNLIFQILHDTMDI